MKTEKQKLGDWGEKLICKKFYCFKCKKKNSLKQLPTNFKCADLICDFCGYVAQVKTKNTKDISRIPNKILGAAWGPQKDRMDSGIFIPLFIVLKCDKSFSVFYLPADLQTEKLFHKRKPLSENARRAGWQGFTLDGEYMQKYSSRLI
jgi:hypothetical protein